MDKQASDTYRAQQIMSASPAERVAMLYDETVRALRKAVQAIDEDDIEARWKGNKKAQDILYHLDETLDFDQGGEIALNLSRLYRYILRRLIQVDLDNDPAPAEEAVELLKPLRDSWRQLSARNEPVPANLAKPAAPRARTTSAAAPGAQGGPTVAISA